MELKKIETIVENKLERVLSLINETEDEIERTYYIRCYDSILSALKNADKQEFNLWFWGMVDKVTKAQLRTLYKKFEYLPTLNA